MALLAGWSVVEWSALAALITWLLTLLGLAISNRQANTRESRKEYRSALDNLQGNVDRLLAAYLTYLTELTPAVKNEQARISIYAELNRLRRHVESLNKQVGVELSAAYGEIFEAITGGDFESKNAKPAEALPKYLRAVTAAERLMECAERWFQKVYFRTGFMKFLLG